MSYTIICPYCFAKMSDEEVLFRSERVNEGDCEFLPDGYFTTEDFIENYHGVDKEELLAKVRDWDFFAKTEDPEYKKFWDKFVETTEFHPDDDRLGVPSYHRRVIDPTLEEHNRFLRRQPDGSWFLRDSAGMVTGIELEDDGRRPSEKCFRRVCRYCRNPLPAAYGKHSVKFTTVIGITGSGKTVYISQLLRDLETYAANVGLSALTNTANSRTFLDANPIAENVPLPPSTPAGYFQQPLFYELIWATPENKRITETFVLYDVAGEVFDHPDQIYKIAPFIEHADGIIMLLDPLQLRGVNRLNSNTRALRQTTAALTSIHHLVTEASGNERCQIPLAVCISKSDLEEVRPLLGDRLCNLLIHDVHGGMDSTGRPAFNEEEYEPISKELTQMMERTEIALVHLLQANFSKYAYFAFTALGCRVEEAEKEGRKYQYPVGPIRPKRIEEPLYWLFYKLGYINNNKSDPNPFLEIECRNPKCRKREVIEIDVWEEIPRHFPLCPKMKHLNRHCTSCGYEWEEE